MPRPSCCTWGNGLRAIGRRLRVNPQSVANWVAHGQSQTYAVEAVNAELRHYLARLNRRSRCFSNCIEALRAGVKLFVVGTL